MQCFARWREEHETGVCFRDQTILQFGDGWDLLASFVLLNPGSALPGNATFDGFLESKNLPYNVKNTDCHYYQFSIDRLMGDLFELYAGKHSGGVLKLYNLFNLKNQDSGKAIEQFKINRDHADILTNPDDIYFGDAPVVIATGDGAFADEALTTELKKYIGLANHGQLYSVSKIENKSFAITKAQPDKDGIVSSYHPSYTFKYGNTTKLI